MPAQHIRCLERNAIFSTGDNFTYEISEGCVPQCSEVLGKRGMEILDISSNSTILLDYKIQFLGIWMEKLQVVHGDPRIK